MPESWVYGVPDRIGNEVHREDYDHEPFRARRPHVVLVEDLQQKSGP